MYTVEIEFDSCTITSMDDTGEMPDVTVDLLDSVRVELRQFQPDEDVPQVVSMTPRQWLEITTAMQSPAGAYRLEYRERGYYE